MMAYDKTHVESTDSLILDLLGLSPLEGGAVTAVLEALRGDQALDLGGLGVWPLALALGLHLSPDDIVADLKSMSALITIGSVVIGRKGGPPGNTANPNRSPFIPCAAAQEDKGRRVLLTLCRRARRRQAKTSRYVFAFFLCGRERETAARPGSRKTTYIVFLGEAKELADLGGALGAETLRVHDVCEARDVGLALLDDAEREHRQVVRRDASANRLALALAVAARAVARVAVR